MDAKIIAGILAAGGAALAAGGVYRMNKKTGYFKKGNSVRYDVSRIPFKKTSPLKGKTVVFLGSSVTKGFAAHNNAFAEYIAKKDSCICIKEAVNGTTLIDNCEDSYIERMRDKTPEAARWMASHPHEWQRVAPGHGIRMRGANWMPAHALVRTSELSRDLYENRVVAGFPLHLASETRRLAQAIEDAVRVGAGPLDAETNGRMAAVRIVSSEADVLRGYGIVFSRIAELYRDALGVTPEPVNRLPAPARHFIETSQYRLVYELMREWFELRPGEAEKLGSRLASVTSPRLYEYFSLVSLLGGLERRGWTSVEAKRHEYAGAGPLYADNAAAALLNTIIFRRKEDDGGNEEIVRLWYQPVLAAGNVEPENGIGLARTTRWSVRPLNAEAADTLRETDRAWYSPDFLISLESGGRKAWAVMDSKYSTVGTVLRHHAMQQAFKYLTSLGTVRKDDVYAGLWLYCGSVANDRTQEGAFFNASAPDVLPVPDMVLERVNALSEADPVAGVLERLRTVLAR